MLVLMFMSLLVPHASVDIFVLSFVLPSAYAWVYVASENQALEIILNIFIVLFQVFRDDRKLPISANVRVEQWW